MEKSGKVPARFLKEEERKIILVLNIGTKYRGEKFFAPTLFVCNVFCPTKSKPIFVRTGCAGTSSTDIP